MFIVSVFCIPLPTVGPFTEVPTMFVTAKLPAPPKVYQNFFSTASKSPRTPHLPSVTNPSSQTGLNEVVHGLNLETDKTDKVKISSKSLNGRATLASRVGSHLPTIPEPRALTRTSRTSRLSH
eukprot:NODE_617_length_5364_cov_0.787654.p6 type:complete len:123 gc:universal NODE_617_length_5364_cov_0.787654:4362-4730(+)